MFFFSSFSISSSTAYFQIDGDNRIWSSMPFQTQVSFFFYSSMPFIMYFLNAAEMFCTFDVLFTQSFISSLSFCIWWPFYFSLSLYLFHSLLVCIKCPPVAVRPLPFTFKINDLEECVCVCLFIWSSAVQSH